MKELYSPLCGLFGLAHSIGAFYLASALGEHDQHITVAAAIFIGSLFISGAILIGATVVGGSK